MVLFVHSLWASLYATSKYLLQGCKFKPLCFKVKQRCVIFIRASAPYDSHPICIQKWQLQLVPVLCPQEHSHQTGGFSFIHCFVLTMWEWIHSHYPCLINAITERHPSTGREAGKEECHRGAHYIITTLYYKNAVNPGFDTIEILTTFEPLS